MPGGALSEATTGKTTRVVINYHVVVVSARLSWLAAQISALLSWRLPMVRKQANDADRSPHRGLVVGADGSSPSNAAMRWAAQDAAMRKVALTLVHVLPIGLPKWGMGLAIAPPPAQYLRMQEEEDRRVIAEAARVAGETTAEYGPVHVEQRGADLQPDTHPDRSEQGCADGRCGLPRSGAVGPWPVRVGQHGADPSRAVPGGGHPRRDPARRVGAGGRRR